MGHNEKRAYLEAIRKRYRKAKRELKSKILDEFCEVCRYNRKYAIRALSQAKRKRKRLQPGRRPWYAGERLLPPLTAIWLASDQMCSKKLKVALSEWLPFYEQERLCKNSAVMVD